MSEMFYKFDKRVGSACNINGKSAYASFGADLKELQPITGGVVTEFTRTVGKSNLRVNNQKFDVSGLTVVFYVGGQTKQSCYINTSNLIEECKDCIITTDEDNFEYVAVLTNYNVVETGIDFYNEVTLTFSAVKRLALVKTVFDTGNGSVFNLGNVTSGMKITITPKADLSTFMINGITIKNLTANMPFIIDGLQGEVLCNGINRFLDTDLIEFPKVKPGKNQIGVSNTNVTVEVSYYPTFII